MPHEQIVIDHASDGKNWMFLRQIAREGICGMYEDIGVMALTSSVFKFDTMIFQFDVKWAYYR